MVKKTWYCAATPKQTTEFIFSLTLTFRTAESLSRFYPIQDVFPAFPPSLPPLPPLSRLESSCNLDIQKLNPFLCPVQHPRSVAHGIEENLSWIWGFIHNPWGMFAHIPTITGFCSWINRGAICNKVKLDLLCVNKQQTGKYRVLSL